MATVGVMNGTRLRLYYNTTGATFIAVGNSLTVKLNFSHSLRETTNQDSGGHAEFLEGKRLKSVDFAALHAEDATQDFKAWYDKLDGSDRGLVKIRVTSTESGDTYYEYNAYLTALNLDNGGPEGNAQYDGAAQVTGQGSPGTVA